MTNQQGAPEALRPIQRFNNICGLMNPEARGLYVRYEDHVAALIEAQQPAPSAPATSRVAELEDVLRAVDRLFDQTGELAVPDGCRWGKVAGYVKDALAAAPQPSPTPQAASSAVLKAIRAANMQLVRTGDDEFMLVTYKNARAQCDGGKCGIGGYCDDCPTPQTDSQPAPEYVGNGMFKGETIQKAAEHWASWCDVRCMTGLSEFLRVVAARAQADSVCYDYAKQIAESMWATHYKADAPHWESCDSLMGVLSQISNMMCGLSRAPADSVTAPVGADRHGLPPLPDPDLRDVGTTPRDIKEFLRGYATSYALTALAARTQADSRPAQFVDQTSAILSDKAVCASTVIDKPAPLLDRDRIREIFMEHGFTVKEGQTDLKQYVYDAADALLRAARAPADSVTAPAGVVGDAVDAIALARYKVVPAHESMFHRFAVVADGKQQLYLGREVECENMARKFAGAFLDGAFYQSNIATTPPAQADSVLSDAEIDRIVPALEPVSEDFPAGWAVWKDRERIRKELRAARAPADSVTAPAGGANWQDISTAPKDGTRFVAVGNNYGLYSETQHTCIAQWFRGCWMDVSEWNETSELKYLTHWMPLLPLPGTAARKQGGA